MTQTPPSDSTQLPPPHWLETVLALLGALTGAAYVVGTEILNTSCAHRPFPWGVIIIVATCVLPATIGRRATRKILGLLASKAQ